MLPKELKRTWRNSPRTISAAQVPLLILYEIQTKIKHRDSTSLIRVRVKIDAMIAKQKTAIERQGVQGCDVSQVE